MHFSIPSTQEFGSEGGGSSFTGFNIHINGSFHCCLRYKQLHSLHEQLKRSLPSMVLPSFPPKKLLSLTPNQIEQRRLSLERYIQLVGQDPVLCRSELLRAFLLNAQQESSFTECNEVTLDVYLMNGYRIAATVYSTDCTPKVLAKATALIDLPFERLCYFALYLMRIEATGELTIVKRLMDFEAPYISQKQWDGCRLVLRTGYWDPCYDVELMRDRIALNLLYMQALSDVKRGWVVTTRDLAEQLTNLQARGNKSEYLEIVRKLPLYGCLQFPRACVDYPEPNTVATVALGNKELNLLSCVDEGKEMQETKFKVTRIRCWRVTPIHATEEQSTNGHQTHPSTIVGMELSFEYLMAKNQLKWITIYSEQSMLMSVCLQSIVDELLNQKNGSDPTHLPTPPHTEYAPPLSYIRRDGSNHGMTDSSSTDTLSNVAHSDTTSNCTSTQSNNHSTNTTTNGSSFIRRKLKELNTTVRFRSGRDSVHNEAFEWIGDDDL